MEAAVLLIAGAVIGYLVRLTEFRRDRRLQAYSDLVGTFLTTAHNGAALQTFSMRLGDKVRDAEHRAEVEPWWDRWAESAEAFEAATARFRMLGSRRAIAEAEKLESFIQENVRQVEPVMMTEGTRGWGEAAKVGPSEVDKAAVRMARAFSDAVRGDVVGWSFRRRSEPVEGEPT